MGDFTLKAEQRGWMRSNVSTMVKTYSCGYPRDLGSPSATQLCHLFSTTSTVDGGTNGGCSVALVVSLFVSLIMDAIAVYSRLQKSCNKQAEQWKTTIDLLCLNQEGMAC